MAKRFIPQEAVQQRIAELDARIRELDMLRLRRETLQELLADSVERDDDDGENPTLTDQIIEAIRKYPGNRSGEIAQHLVKIGAAGSIKSVQTIIGQLAKRTDAPIVRQDDGKLYQAAVAAPPNDITDVFPATLVDEDDDLPF